MFFHLEKRAGRIIHFHCFMHIQVSTTFPLCLVSYFLFFVGDKRRQILISRLLSNIIGMYVASICLDFR